MTISLQSPYAEGEHCLWLRGNLHAHSKRSDGARDPQAVIDDYARLGYDFLALSDHNVPSDYSGLDARGMVLLAGNERGGNGQEVLQVGGRGDAATGVSQLLIDNIHAGGGLAVLAHPSWETEFNHYTFEDLLALKGYEGLEVFNSAVISSLGSASAVEKWDRLLTLDRIVWGFANDDSHRSTQDGRAWNMAQVPKDRRTPAGVLEALRRGSFYASTGVKIEELACRGAELRAVAPNAEAIEILGDYAQRLAWTEGPEIRFDASNTKASFIRVQFYGRAGTMAWAQPMPVLGGEGERLRKLTEKKPSLKVSRRKGGGAEPKARPQVFYNFKNGLPVEAGTAFGCTLAGRNLVFDIRCTEPRMDSLRLQIHADAHLSLWSDDSVEVFLDSEGLGIKYLQFIVSAAGHSCVLEDKRLRADIRCNCKVKRDQSGWSAALAIPLDSFRGASTAPRTRWGLNVCRNRSGIGEYSTWSWLGPSSHTPCRFGSLIF